MRQKPEVGHQWGKVPHLLPNLNINVLLGISSSAQCVRLLDGSGEIT